MTDDGALHLDGLVIDTVDGRRLTLDGRVGAGQLVAVDAGPGDCAEIARVVAGLDERRVGGSVRVLGDDLTERPPNDRSIGYVPAGGGLLPHLTVRQNLEYGLVRRPDLTADMIDTRIKAAAEHFDLTLVLHVRPHQTTDDARLRAAVARAAVGYPAVLVIDLSDRRPDDTRGLPYEMLRNASLPRSLRMAVLACSPDPVMHTAADGLISPVVAPRSRKSRAGECAT